MHVRHIVLEKCVYVRAHTVCEGGGASVRVFFFFFCFRGETEREGEARAQLKHTHTEEKAAHKEDKKSIWDERNFLHKNVFRLSFFKKNAK